MIRAEFDPCRRQLWLSLSTRQADRSTSEPDALDSSGLRRSKREEAGAIGAIGPEDTRALDLSQDWPGPPHDAGRTRRGPSQCIRSQESCDPSTIVSISSLLFPSILSWTPDLGPLAKV